MIRIYFYTLGISFLSTAVAFVVGIIMAFFTSQRNFFGKKLVLASGVVPLCVPPLIIALGYVGFFGVNGFFNSLMEKLLFWKSDYQGNSFLYSWLGVIIAQGFYNFPLVTKIIHDAWSLLSKEQENAARLLGTGEVRIFFTITLPRLSGAIFAAVIPVFLFCFFSFMIVLLFSPAGTSTLEVEIYNSVRSTLDYSRALKLSIIETATALSIVFAYIFLIRHQQMSTDSISYYDLGLCSIGKSKNCSKKTDVFEKFIFVIFIVIIILFFAGPLVSIFISSFSIKKNNSLHFGFEQFVNLFKSRSFLLALWNSIWTGLCSSFISCLISLLFSIGINSSKRQKNAFIQMIPFLPMAISSVVLGWIFSLIFRRGNAFVFVLVQAFVYWPIACRQIINCINKIDKDTKNAAILLSKNKFDCFKRFYLPSCKSVLISAFTLCFGISLGDSTLPLMLSIPNFNTLALYTYKLAASYRFNQASCCGVIIILLCVSISKGKNIFLKKYDKGPDPLS